MPLLRLLSIGGAVQHFTAATLAIGLLLATWAAVADEPAPFADVHLHFNWDQAEQLTPAQAIQRLTDNRVVLAVVSSTPPELALELRRAGGDWVIPLYRPYLDAQGRHRWFVDERVLDGARQALASGKYLGIGEFHLIPGIGPRKDNKVLHGLVQLGIEYDVPVLVHTEASDYRYFLPLCSRYPKARFLWAHAGGLLSPDQVAALLRACPNVWVDLSARDPWRYVDTPITDADGRLLPQWTELLQAFPDRFMTGADPVWPVEDLQHWSIPDAGWERLGEFLAFHRRWLSFLPADLAENIRLKNAQRFFNHPGR